MASRADRLLLRAGQAATAAVLAVLLAACSVTPRGTEDFELVIVHSNDTHANVSGVDARGEPCARADACSGGFARLAQAILDARRSHPHVLALDAGDQWQGGLLFTLFGAQMIADLDRLMPFDAVTLGNHELDNGCQAAADFVAHHPLPVLAANIDPQASCPLAQARTVPWMIKTYAGTRVAVIGVMNDEVIERAHGCPQTRFLVDHEAVQKAVDTLRAQGVKHIVALTHIGYGRDLALARAVSGVDVIVGGHTHDVLGSGPGAVGPYPTVAVSPAGQPVLVVTAGDNTRALGELTVRFDAQGVPVAWQGGARSLVPEARQDAQVRALVAAYEDKATARPEAALSVNPHQFADGIDACRAGECLTGLLACDAALDYFEPQQAQIALIQAGTFRTGLPAGPVHWEHVKSAMPFGNRLNLVQLSGEAVWQSLEHGVSASEVTGAWLVHAAGLRYRVDPARPAGERVRAVQVSAPGGSWLDLDRLADYRVVLSDFLLAGGDGFTQLATGRALAHSAVPLNEIVRRYLQRQPLVPLPRSGRMSGLPERVH